MPLNVTLAKEPQQPAAEKKYVPVIRSPSKAPSQAGFAPGSLPPGAEETEKPAAGAPAAAGKEQEKPEGVAGEEEKGPDAWRFAKLAEKDRAARARLKEAQEVESRIQKLKEEMDKREADLKKRLEEDDARRTKWRKDPKALLMDNGYSPEAALQYMLNGERLTPEQQLAASVEDRLAAQERETEEKLAVMRAEQEKREQAEEAARKKKEEDDTAAEEQQAVEELQAEIGEILEADLRSYPLIAKAESKNAGRGIQAVYAKVQEMSDAHLEEHGKRPLVTTRLLEKAIAAVESDARAELQETLKDEEIAKALGISGVQQRRQTTLPNTPPRRAAPTAPEEGTPSEETDSQRRRRVVAAVEAIWQRQRSGR